MSDWQSVRDARVKRLRTELARIYDEDAGAAVAGALADLRHICDAHGLAFGERDEEAHQQYLAEKEAALPRDLRLWTRRQPRA